MSEHRGESHLCYLRVSSAERGKWMEPVGRDACHGLSGLDVEDQSGDVPVKPRLEAGRWLQLP